MGVVGRRENDSERQVRVEKVGGDSSARTVGGKNEKTSTENQCKDMPHPGHRRKEMQNNNTDQESSLYVHVCRHSVIVVASIR